MIKEQLLSTMPNSRNPFSRNHKTSSQVRTLTSPSKLSIISQSNFHLNCSNLWSQTTSKINNISLHLNLKIQRILLFIVSKLQEVKTQSRPRSITLPEKGKQTIMIKQVNLVPNLQIIPNQSPTIVNIQKNLTMLFIRSPIARANLHLIYKIKPNYQSTKQRQNRQASNFSLTMRILSTFNKHTVEITKDQLKMPNSKCK